MLGGFSVPNASENRYRIVIPGEPGAMTNGDRYRFSIRAADGGELARGAYVATYQESFPNGNECDGVACKRAIVTVR